MSETEEVEEKEEKEGEEKKEEEEEKEEEEKEEKIESIHISSATEPIFEITDRSTFEVNIGLSLGFQVGIRTRKLIAKSILWLAIFGGFIWTPAMFVLFLLINAITVPVLLSIWSVPFILITTLAALHSVLPSLFK